MVALLGGNKLESSTSDSCPGEALQLDLFCCRLMLNHAGRNGIIIFYLSVSIEMENVPRVRTSKSMEAIRATLKAQGYGLSGRVMDASLCGVPQARKRYFLVGCLGAPDGFLDPYLEKGLSDHQMTIREYLGNELGIDYYFRIPRSYTRRAIFSIDEPSVTIRGVDRPIPPNYKLHPNDAADLSQARCLTPKERSRIQTFPESFKFFGSKTDINQMVGNAVPVNLATYVARALLEYRRDVSDGLR